MDNTCISAIICAYNEERTIDDLLFNVCNSRFFGEIIVVNDGSTDQTPGVIDEYARRFSLRALHLATNRGKGAAMAEGINLAKGTYLVFIDADLSNFNRWHAALLVDPLLKGEADMILGIPGKTLIPERINPFKHLSGQRAVRKKDLLPLVEQMHSLGYGVETLINHYFRKKGYRVKRVVLKGLYHPCKFQKFSPLKAIRSFIREGWQIFLTHIALTRAFLTNLK